jgi:hypothetical protein
MMMRSSLVLVVCIVVAIIVAGNGDVSAARLCPQSPKAIPIPNLTTNPPTQIAQVSLYHCIFISHMCHSKSDYHFE